MKINTITSTWSRDLLKDTKIKLNSEKELDNYIKSVIERLIKIKVQEQNSRYAKGFDIYSNVYIKFITQSLDRWEEKLGDIEISNLYKKIKNR